MAAIDAILFGTFLGKAGWLWLSFFALVVLLLVLDLGVLHRDRREIGPRESLLLSAFYVTLGLLFGGWVWWQLGSEAGLAYLTGFAVEKTLAMDNIFVIAMIFSYFAVPARYQHRVLFWGVLGVILLRAVMIGLGAALVEQFSWVLLLFAVFLLVTGVKMLWMDGTEEVEPGGGRLVRFLESRLPVTRELHGERFFVRQADPATGRSALFATPLFLALVKIEVADLIFAVDSVPAIFAITTDPFVVYTSNIFAILGLRALYFALAAMIERFRYLKTALALVLVFIGGKIIAADLLGIEKVPAAFSLAVTLAILAAGVAYSLWRTRPELRAAEH